MPERFHIEADLTAQEFEKLLSFCATELGKTVKYLSSPAERSNSAVKLPQRKQGAKNIWQEAQSWAH